jgi:hypothetical protein
MNRVPKMIAISSGFGRLLKITFAVGVPLTLLGIVAGWNTGPHGAAIFFVVALVPSVLLLTRDMIPRELFWFVLPFAQFIYYFLWASIVLGVTTLAKDKPTVG